MRRNKICLNKLENIILEKYFFKAFSLEEITAYLKNKQYNISREAIRKYINNIKNILSASSNFEEAKKTAFIKYSYQIDLDLLKKLY